MSSHKPNVLVTFDSLKYPNTGLYYFGQSLGNALLTQNNGRLHLNYYLKKKSESIFKGKVDLVFLKKLHQLFLPGSKRFNLVHFTDQYCRLKPQKVHCNKILTIHDLNQVYEYASNSAKLNTYLQKLEGYINASDHVVAISNYVAADIRRYFPQTEHKISVIYNGADELVPVPGHKPIYVPQRRFLFTIGMLSEKKNFHVLPALLKGNNLELVIAGIDTPYRNKIMAEAENLGCADRVIITGPVSDADKAWYYANCDAFVFPSLAEGFGLPVIEAMYFGKPVFLSTHTSLPEIGGDKAYYFNSFEGDDMRAVFLNGMTDFTINNKAHAVKDYAQTFSWEKTAAQYLQLYQQILF